MSSKFDMKDLNDANFILGMEITRYHAHKKDSLNQRIYVETVLHSFNMQKSKSIKVPIHVGAKLSVEQCPKTQEKEDM